ncbi:hypothetical protein E4P41_12360 [Geodermatophilus sp. DF01-2]|uniref:hypothetical protein n=1 Tax=Geodermatophilus sp. DF01-2 TaxID=2559610 RepID=UPI0010735D4F|nr:hypothetical protein [Geodermatophilus sp. DF01_2]TFV59012.1 hypothetical protein E4P41_12360 [Geodermatophilus sp. DF01_2]
MTEREQSPAAGARGPDDWREQTIPGMQPVRSPWADGAAADPRYAPGRGPGPVPGYGSPTAPDYSTRPVRVRRPDSLASLLLILAGIAAGVSLLLRWLPGSELTGWELVRSGFDDLGGGAGELLGSRLWQPMAVVLGGAALFVLGLLMVLPARTHRFLGVLALLVSLVAGAGVLVPLADVGWAPDTTDTGFWFAVAVPVFGLLGALKAMFTR